MTTVPETATAPTASRTPRGTERADAARDHLWMHFTRHSTYEGGGRVPIMVRGEGCRVWDADGREYLDGLAGLFVVQAGHGRRELAETAARQAADLAYFPIWSYAHPAAIDLAERLAHYAPGDLNRVFFTTGGGEAVESAWKLAKQYFKLTGKPTKHKVISRSIAYHGTPQGALAITGVPDLRTPYEPLVPGAFKVPNTNAYRAPEHVAGDLKAFGRWAADQVEQAILAEGAGQRRGRVRRTGAERGRLLPAAARLLRAAASDLRPSRRAARVRRGDLRVRPDREHVRLRRASATCPDIITCAKGMTSGYSPIGAMIASERLFEPFRSGATSFLHGYTFGGHPVSAAVAMANLDIFEREGLNEHVREQSPVFRATLEKLLDLPIVGDVRGEGFFFGIELVKDKATKETFNPEESERLLRGFLSKALFDAGLYCRADDRGDPVVQLSPPLVAGPAEFDEIEQILRGVLTEAWARL